MRFPCVALLVVVSCGGLVADEPYLTVNVTRPGRLLEHPLVNRVRDALFESPDYVDRLRTPEMQRIDGVRRLVEGTLGTGWQEGIDRLAHHVELRAFDPRKPRDAVVVMQARNRETLSKVLTTLAGFNADLQPFADDAAGSTGSPTVRRLGEAFVAIDEHRVIASPFEERVRDSIGRGLGSTKEGDGPVLDARVDLSVLRELPMVAEGLTLPGPDAGAVATIGGWIEHLGRGRELRVTLSTTDEAVSLAARLASDAPTADDPRVAGFFVPAGETAPAPLAPEGTILSAAWYTDYARMWENRRSIVTEAVADRVERRDAEIGKELEVLGLRSTPIGIARMLGTDYHVLVTRGGRNEYDVDLDERLPRAAFAVSLRDESGFRAALQPVFRTFGLILAAEQSLLVTTEKHGDAEITTARFRDDDASARTGNRLRFHTSPSWTIADGHFVIGSTRSIVVDVLTELAKDERADSPTTSSNVLSLSAAAEAIDDAETLITSRMQLDQGIGRDRANAELDVARTVLRTLGGIRTRTTATDDTITVTLDIGSQPH